MRCPILPAREFSSRVRRTPLCSTHVFHGRAWKRWKPCETTIMPGRESKGSRDYARRPPRGRFTSSPNRPKREPHRPADSDTSDVAMQHPHKSFHPTPLRVERDQAFLGIWKHTHAFPIENGGAGEWHGVGRPSLPRGDL